MDDHESEREKNPYMSSFYKNPPPAATRPFSTNRAPNPYHPGVGTRHFRPESRLGTYALDPEEASAMVRYSEQPVSSLISAAVGSSPSVRLQPRASPFGAVRPTSDTNYYNEKLPISKKRGFASRNSSSDLSEHEDGEFSPATTRRLASTPNKKRKTYMSTRHRTYRRILSDDDYEDESFDPNDEEKDILEEEALERELRQRRSGLDDSLYSRSSAFRRLQHGAPMTPGHDVACTTPNGRSTSSLKKKPRGKPVPRDLKSADIADRMMFRWKNSGRPWEEIREEYEKLTGIRPAASSLSVRYIKLNENLAANGFKNEIHESFYQNYPARKYLAKYTKLHVQEVALLKAVAEADIKLSQVFWKEVSVQMKNITEELHNPSTLRNKYEAIKKKQFYFDEDSLSQDEALPALADNSTEPLGLFSDAEVGFGSSGTKFDSGIHGLRQPFRNSPLSKQVVMDADGLEGSVQVSSQLPASFSPNSKALAKVDGVSGMTGSSNENENESPSHTHPRISHVNPNDVLASSSSLPTNKGHSSPTPAAAIGAASTRTANSQTIGTASHVGLVDYGDSDESE